jgi:hypothetical protein
LQVGFTAAPEPRLPDCERPLSALKRHPHATTDGQLATHLDRSPQLSRWPLRITPHEETQQLGIVR